MMPIDCKPPFQRPRLFRRKLQARRAPVANEAAALRRPACPRRAKGVAVKPIRSYVRPSYLVVSVVEAEHASVVGTCCDDIALVGGRDRESCCCFPQGDRSQ